MELNGVSFGRETRYTNEQFIGIANGSLDESDVMEDLNLFGDAFDGEKYEIFLPLNVV